MVYHYMVHYAEIGLKGKNRPDFERQLVRNIRRQHPVTGVRRLPGRIVVESEVPLYLGDVFGLAWWAEARLLPADLGAIAQGAEAEARENSDGVSSFAVDAKVVGEGFSHRARDLEVTLGQRIKDALGLRVDLTHPDLTVFVEVLYPEAFLYTNKRPGPGGLPVGVSGKLMGLFSGGIDSAVAAYLMAKRGAALELVHFHALPEAAQAHEAKAGQLAGALARFLPSLVVHYVPYWPFQLATASLPPRLAPQELVVFRRFMWRVAARLAGLRRAGALFTGDSLGQVASQTLWNLMAADQAVDMSVFRPLIAYDKREIIDLARKLGLYELSIQPYKDCCSIIARGPATRAKLERIAEIEGEINLAKLVEETLGEVVTYRYFPQGEASPVA